MRAVAVVIEIILGGVYRMKRIQLKSSRSVLRAPPNQSLHPTDPLRHAFDFKLGTSAVPRRRSIVTAMSPNRFCSDNNRKEVSCNVAD
jgi:hypothetical protein